MQDGTNNDKKENGRDSRFFQHLILGQRLASANTGSTNGFLEIFFILSFLQGACCLSRLSPATSGISRDSCWFPGSNNRNGLLFAEHCKRASLFWFMLEKASGYLREPNRGANKTAWRGRGRTRCFLEFFKKERLCGKWSHGHSLGEGLESHKAAIALSFVEPGLAMFTRLHMALFDGELEDLGSSSRDLFFCDVVASIEPPADEGKRSGMASFEGQL